MLHKAVDIVPRFATLFLPIISARSLAQVCFHSVMLLDGISQEAHYIEKIRALNLIGQVHTCQEGTDRV